MQIFYADVKKTTARHQCENRFTVLFKSSAKKGS